MSNEKKHLSFNERLKIERGLKDKMSVPNIAKSLRRHKSCIYRELARGRYTHLNSDYTTEERYSPDIAESKYREMLKNKGRPLKIGKDIELANFIEDKIINDNFSPYAVVEHINNNGLVFSTTICSKTIYNYIEKGVFLNLTKKQLPRHGKKKQKYEQIERRPARASKGDSIELRPSEVLTRNEFGHWEMDTVIGCKKCRSVLLVLTERKHRFELISKLPNKEMASVVKAVDDMERRFGNLFPHIFKSITCDNGSEFSDPDGLERSVLVDAILGSIEYNTKRTKVYYCHPRSPGERGSNENANLLIRRFFPKGTNFDKVSVREINHVNNWINDYPRKCLGGACALMRFRNEIESLRKIAE